MPRVIDTIRINSLLRSRLPEMYVPFSGEGLQCIIDVSDTSWVNDYQPQRSVRITRPDGSYLIWPMAGVLISHGIPSVYFANMTESQLPRLSLIEWA